MNQQPLIAVFATVNGVYEDLKIDSKCYRKSDVPSPFCSDQQLSYRVLNEPESVVF